MTTIANKTVNGVQVLVQADRISKNNMYQNKYMTPVDLDDLEEYLKKEAYYCKTSLANKGKRKLSITITLTAYENVIKDVKKAQKNWLDRQCRKYKIDAEPNVKRGRANFASISRFQK